MAVLCLFEASFVSPTYAGQKAPSGLKTAEQGATRGPGSIRSTTADSPPSTTFTIPASGTTVQSGTSLDVTWTEADGGGTGISSRSLQRQVADVVTKGTCNGVTWSNDGSADTNGSPRTVGGLAVDYADNFARTVSANSWGTADSGGAYSLTGTTNGSFSVGGSYGNLAISAGNNRSAAALLSTGLTTADIRSKFKLDKLPTGAAVNAVFGARAVSASLGGYYAQVIVQTSGTVQYNFVRLANSNGAQTSITTAANTGLTGYTANRWINVRFSVSGTSPTSLSLKVWYDGTSEPGTWFTASDSNADQQQAGAVALGAVTGASVSNLPVTTSFDYVSASDGNDPGRCYRWQETLTNGNNESATTTSGNVLVDTSYVGTPFVFPPAGTTIQSSSTADVVWAESDGGSGISTQSLQRQSASVVTAGTCSGVTWSNDGSADANASPRTVGGLTSDYRDNFVRTVAANSWGTSEIGGAYTLFGTSNGTFSVDGSYANLAIGATNNRSVGALLSSSLTTTDVRSKVSLDKVPTGGSMTVQVGARAVSTTLGGYYGQLVFNTTGTIYGNFIRLANSGGAQTAITSAADSGVDVYSANRWLNVRFSATGTSPTTLGLKVWYDGSPEPANWTFTATDSNTDQQQAGSIVLGAVSAASVSNLGITTKFDYLSASDDNDTATCYRWTENITNGAGQSASATSGSLLIDDSSPSAIYPNGGGVTSSRTLTWTVPTAQYSYDAQVATDLGFTANLADSGTVTSSVPSRLVPTASLTDGTLYYWRVRVASASGGSLGAWSTTGSFVYQQGATLGLPSQDSFESFPLGNSDVASINVSTGNLVFSHPLVSLPIVGGALSLGLTYNSQSTANVGNGPGWRLNAMRRLTELASGDVTYAAGDGSIATFTKISTVGTVTTYTRPSMVYATLRKDTSQTLEWTLTYRDQSVDSFDVSGSDGLLAKQADRFGNAVTFSYTSGTNRLSQATDPSSRVIDFAWNTGASPAQLTSITDWAYVSGGVVQSTNTGSRRQYRFFYDGSGNLIGWSNPLNTLGNCSTQQSNLTCLTYNSNSLLATVTKRMTQAVLSSGSIGTSTRDATTTITYRGNEVSQYQDAQQTFDTNTGTTLQRNADSQMQVQRPGSVTTTTTYGFVASTDTLGRVQSVWRKLGATQIEQRTVWDAALPTERDSVTDNYGAQLSTPARTISYTYVPGSMGLVSRMIEPLTSSKQRYTDYTYNSNNDLTQTVVYKKGSTAQTITRYCYATSGCATTGNTLTIRAEIDDYVDGTKGGTNGNDQDVTTEYLYDSHGQRTRKTRYNYDGSGTSLDSRAIGYTYDTNGNQTALIDNYANGVVSSTDPSDVDPDATTLARTDLTTTFTYDTAGNQVSSSDPRRAIALARGANLNADDYVLRTYFDGVNEAIQTTLARDPADSASPQSSASVYDELGDLRQTTDYAGLVSASQFDRAGRVTQTFEDVDGSWSASAVVSSVSTFDRAGRVLTTKDRNQADDSSLGYTSLSYDELGRKSIEVDASGTGSSSSTTYSYDSLDRLVSTTAGYGTASAQTTTTSYDLGGRVLATDDEFTCSQSTYDYRDVTLTVTTGLSSGNPCTGTGDRTVTNTYDSLARLTRSEVTAGTGTGDRTFDVTVDSAGRKLTSAVKTGGVTSATTYTLNPLDQTIAEAPADGSTNKSNYDAAGNPTDKCFWASGTTVGTCYEVGHSGWTNRPTQVTSSSYDARNNVISFTDGVSGLTTTYDPTSNYQVSAEYLATGAGQEHQILYTYDPRHRLWTVTDQLCTTSTGHSCLSTTTTGSDTYVYDDNDNRTTVTENNGSSTTTAYYCYDAQNRLVARKSASNCTGTTSETYAYDDGGNRTQAVVSGTTTNFAYDATGQLCNVGSASCGTPNVTYDSVGRTASYNGWVYQYDAEGRMTEACKSTSCSGSVDNVQFTYDGDGRRTELTTTTAGGTVTTTDFVYHGDSIVQEKTNGTVSREYVHDASGSIVKFCDPNCASPTSTYLVTWNGHGDAIGIWRINSDGTLTLANSYTYSSWGTPTTTVASGFSDLGFRFLYVGAHQVQWDNFSGLAAYYMHARHYAPALGRFLQPDPAHLESSVYVYSKDNPTTTFDPNGLMSVVGGTTMEDFGYANIGLIRGLVTILAVSTSVAVACKALDCWSDKHCFVIAAGNERAKIYGERHNCDTMPFLPPFVPHSVKMELNRVWILAHMAALYRLIDLGYGVGDFGDHAFYEMEVRMSWWYPNRLDKFGWMSWMP